jgi:hypothetical protein
MAAMEELLSFYNGKKQGWQLVLEEAWGPEQAVIWARVEAAQVDIVLLLPNSPEYARLTNYTHGLYKVQLPADRLAQLEKQGVRTFYQLALGIFRSGFVKTVKLVSRPTPQKIEVYKAKLFEKAPVQG